MYFGLHSGSWEYFALLPFGWKMDVPINVGTQCDVADFVLDRLFNFVVQLFQGP